MDLESNAVGAAFSAPSAKGKEDDDEGNLVDAEGNPVDSNSITEDGTASKTEADVNTSDTESKASSGAAKGTRGRGYQENRRGKKGTIEKTRHSGVDLVFTKGGSKRSDDLSIPESSAMPSAPSGSSVPGSSGLKPERRAKGDVSSPSVKRGDGLGIGSRCRQENNPHKPSGDGDMAKQEGASAEQDRG